jgi:hypothetical protein
MAGITNAVTGVVVAKLRATEDGVNARITAIEGVDRDMSALGIRSISALNVGVELSEKSGHVHYPLVLVYCDKMANSLKEKFRRFSGRAHVVVEVRHSEDRLDQMDAGTQVYVDAVCALLDDSRGDWGNGAFYAGGYEVSYEPVVRGGKNFLQRAKVAIEVEISL